MKIQLHHMTVVTLILTAALSSCGKGERHWKEVSQLSGGAMEVHFVVVEPPSAKNEEVYVEAAKSLCNADICQIGFFTSDSDVPIETTTADFFNNGGWKKRNEAALYFRNTNSNMERLTWNCGHFPQPDLNSCISPISPTSAILKSAEKRGPLLGFGHVKFGEASTLVMKELGGSKSVEILDQGSRRILKTHVTFHGRVFDAFFNVVDSRFSTVLMKWKNTSTESACVQEMKSIASGVSSDYGSVDRMNPYDVGGSTYEYLWLFANGATVTLDNLEMTAGECSLSLNFSAKSEDEQ